MNLTRPLFAESYHYTTINGVVYRIPFGSLRGQHLRYDKTIDFHVMLGDVGFKNLATLSKIIRAIDISTIADVGANVGLMSLWLAKMGKLQSTIYAFEPVPDVVKHLKDNLALNHVANVTVIEQACTDAVGMTDFYIGFHHSFSSISADWARGITTYREKITVATTMLDYFFYDEAHPLPDFMKMDIEGGGTLALKGCHRLFTEKRPLLYIESHTPDEDRAISNVLLTYDYACYRVSNNAWVTEPREVHPHPNGVWGAMLLCPADDRSHITRILDT